MNIVGLTGGIGSGKSTVAAHFKKLGVPVYIADEESKKILNTDPAAVKEVKQLLGEESYIRLPNGTLVANRSFIGSKVFKDPKLLEELNQILHPKVRDDFEDWVSQQNAVYVIYEAAILFETGGDQICDYTILVSAPEADRIERVMKRDRANREEVKQRLKNQWSESRRLEKADFIIVNKDLHKTPKFVFNIHEFMLKK